MAFIRLFRKPRNARQTELNRLLRKSLGVKPKDIDLYVLAMRHKSAARNLHNRPELSNERLEFLGDAILDAAVADHLYLEHPDSEEGMLTQMKSRIVSRANLNRMAKQMGINDLIETDLQATNSRESIAGNALEALLGAMYLDLGYAETRKRILYMLDKYTDLKQLADRETDFKSRLYEEAHKMKKRIRFETQTENVSNGTHKFSSKVFLDDEFMGRGQGTSKKKAEQSASKEAIRALTGNGD